MNKADQIRKEYCIPLLFYYRKFQQIPCEIHAMDYVYERTA